MTPGRRLAIKYSVLILLTVGALLILVGPDDPVPLDPAAGDLTRQPVVLLVIGLMLAVVAVDWWRSRPRG